MLVNFILLPFRRKNNLILPLSIIYWFDFFSPINLSSILSYSLMYWYFLPTCLIADARASFDPSMIHRSSRPCESVTLIDTYECVWVLRMRSNHIIKRKKWFSNAKIKVLILRSVKENADTNTHTLIYILFVFINFF